MYIIITVLWISAMAALIVKYYFPESLWRMSDTSPLPDALFEEQWMGAYFQGEKIGYSYRKITKISDGYKISERLKVMLSMMGAEKEFETILDAHTDRLFRLVSFSCRFVSDVDMHAKGKVEGKTIFITLNIGEVTTIKKIRVTERPYINLSMVPYILRNGLKPGKRLTIPVVNPLNMSQEHINVEVLGEDTLMSMGEMRHVHKLKGSLKGIETIVWITKKGEVLREDSPMGFSLVKETKATAVQLSKLSMDVVAQVSIPFRLSLSPGKTEYLKLCISGIDTDRLELDGGRQRLRGDVLEIKKESLESMAAQPFPCKDRTGRGDRNQDGFTREYLKDTMFVQSKDPAIIELSGEVIGEQKNLLEMTRLIHGWVYENIKKEPMITLPLATEVLRMKKGDCNEHTVLFTALARAAGIPTRIAAGLTYRDGFFYYHAWPEVYLNEWVAVDPTLGQFPADASHVRILTGDMDKLVQLIRVIGKIKLEGLEYR